MSAYLPLHVRSVYSLGRGTATPANLVAQAARYGHDALALTDRNNLYGLIPFIEACREHGIRPIVGAELDGPEGLVVLLVQSAEGYANLCQLVTRRQLDANFRLVPSLARHHGGLHVLTANVGLLKQLASHISRVRLWAELAAPRPATFGPIGQAAESLGIGTVATGDVNGAARNEHQLHVTLTAIRKNTLAARLGDRDLGTHRYR